MNALSSKITFSLLFFLSCSAYAHTAIMSCYDNADGTVTCEAGFSDGSSASGVAFKLTQRGKTVLEGRFDEDNSYTFTKPRGAYEALFDAGEGHRVLVKSSDVAE